MACGSGEIESWETNTKVCLYCMATILPQGKHHAWFLWASVSRTNFTVIYLCQSIWPHQAIHVRQTSNQAVVHPTASGFLLSPRSQVHSWSFHLVFFPYLQNEILFVIHSFLPLFIDSRNTHWALATCPVVFYALEIECEQNRLRLVLMPFTLQREHLYSHEQSTLWQ